MKWENRADWNEKKRDTVEGAAEADLAGAADVALAHVAAEGVEGALDRMRERLHGGDGGVQRLPVVAVASSQQEIVLVLPSDGLQIPRAAHPAEVCARSTALDDAPTNVS